MIREVAGGVEISVKVVPGASRSRVVGPHGDALKIQVAAPPEKGKANQAMLALLAAALGVPAADVQLVRGAGSPHKCVRARGIGLQAARKALGAK